MAANDAIADIRRTAHALHMGLRRWAHLLGSLALAGCSYSYPVDAVFIADKLHFAVSEKLNGCLNDFSVISETGELMWAIEGSFRTSPCENSFPLAYGVAPNGLKTRLAAKPLKAGVDYRIEKSDGDRYYGSFRYRRALIITNTPDSARSFQMGSSS